MYKLSPESSISLLLSSKTLVDDCYNFLCFFCTNESFPKNLAPISAPYLACSASISSYSCDLPLSVKELPPSLNVKALITWPPSYYEELASSDPDSADKEFS
jgi:hypothetical protein